MINFIKINVLDKNISVSNLVSISDFKEFINETDYLKYRKGTESWENANLDEDKSLPASVSWHDANAYLAWYEKKYSIPVRLLKSNEYLDIRKEDFEKCSLVRECYYPKTNLISEDFKERLLSPKLLVEEPNERIENEIDIQQYLKFKFPSNIEWCNYKGLKVLVCGSFGEWMAEHKNFNVAMAINTKRLTSARSYMPLNRKYDYFPANSQGNYKRIKIGFRICYEI
jgi:hypothetical protein